MVCCVLVLTRKRAKHDEQLNTVPQLSHSCNPEVACVGRAAEDGNFIFARKLWASTVPNKSIERFAGGTLLRPGDSYVWFRVKLGWSQYGFVWFRVKQKRGDDLRSVIWILVVSLSFLSLPCFFFLAHAHPSRAEAHRQG